MHLFYRLLCNANKAADSVFLLTRPVYASEQRDKVSYVILIAYLVLFFAPFFLCNLDFILWYIL